MGLDMYLTAEAYTSGYTSTQLNAALVGVIGGNRPPAIDDSGCITVEVGVMYWRKANAIHRWFVENVQSGEDDCEKRCVSREDLRALMALCDQVLAARNPDQAEEMLPTESGFFFGSTDYDDWYWKDIQDTADGLHRIDAWIASDEGSSNWDFYYRSSW
jgi:hypothetical protein